MAANLWFWYALGSAVLWGLGYTLAEKILRGGISIHLVMILESIVLLLFFICTFYFQGNVSKQLEYLKSGQLVGLIIFMSLLFCFGNWFIYQALYLKNAAYANLIEISFPFFTIIFSVFLLKNFEMTLPAVMGGILILSGVTLIYLKG